MYACMYTRDFVRLTILKDPFIRYIYTQKKIQDTIYNIEYICNSHHVYTKENTRFHVSTLITLYNITC